MSETRTLIDGMTLASATIAGLRLAQSNHIEVRLGIKDDARHRGGLNLYGRKFDNYPQDIVMRIAHDFPQEGGNRAA